MKCPSCQAPITQEDVFCGSCGRRLTAADKAGGVPAGQPSSFPPMPGPPPPIQPSVGGPPAYQQQAPAYTPPPQQPVIQPTYQQPSPVIQPSYQQPQQPIYGQPQFQATPPAKKKTSGCLIAVIVVIALALCGGVVVGGFYVIPKIIPSATPTSSPYQPPIDSGVPSGTQVVLDVVNNLDVSICYLYVSPSSSDSWGEDWLSELGTIPPGTSASFTVIAGETVDMQTEDCDGNVIDTQYEVYVHPEGITYTLNP